MTGVTDVRPERPGDAAAIRSLLEAAFGGRDEADLVEELRAAEACEIALVAIEAGEVTGHILFSRLDAPMRALALAPLAVLPGRQRSGIGSRLVRAGLGLAQRGGAEAVLVLGDPAYYCRFGFDAEAARGYDSPYAGEHFMACVLRPPVPATGWIRHAAPFRRFECG